MTLSRSSCARSLIVSVPMAVLAACGGGGGGGSGPAGSTTDVTFTSFDAVRPSTTVVMQGISQTMSGTVNGNGTVDNVTVGTVDGTRSTARLTYDATRNLSNMTFLAPQSAAIFLNPDCTSGPVCTGETANASGVASDPRWFGWNYQSYGVWLSEPTLSTFTAGAMSAGAQTPGSAVPTSGNAVFTGLSSGFYFDQGGTPYFASSNMRAAVNWGTRNIDFSTNNTTIGNLLTGAAPTTMAGLDLTGTLTYSAGTSQFNGAVTASGIPAGTTGIPASPAPLSGNANGRFYGPAAQEIGGVYTLSGTGTRERLIGAFGGKR